MTIAIWLYDNRAAVWTHLQWIPVDETESYVGIEEFGQTEPDVGVLVRVLVGLFPVLEAFTYAVHLTKILHHVLKHPLLAWQYRL